MAQRKTALISGASIAGPALAYWLGRGGFAPTLVERAAQPRPGGQAIDIRGKALQVVERMGLLERARAKRTQMKGVSLQDEFGKEIWRSEEKTFSGGRFDNDDVELLRDDLSALLLGAIGDCEILFGDSIVELSEGPNGVAVRFENSTPRNFDLVVGADGVHSKVRRLAFDRRSLSEAAWRWPGDIQHCQLLEFERLADLLSRHGPRLRVSALSRSRQQ